MFHFGRQRFRSKFFAYADSNSNSLALAGAGLYSDAKPDAHADSAASNKNYREPDSNSCILTLTYSGSHAARQSQSAGEPHANSNAWIRV